VILLISGEIWGSKQEYLDQVQELGIADQVIFDDRYIPNEEVGVLFSAADVFRSLPIQYTIRCSENRYGVRITSGCDQIGS
jgi:hypothetical protein